MKKIFFGIVALVAMVATSCQQSFDELNVVGDGDATVSFNVGTPAAIQSRAYSDGKTAQHLQWAVYSITGTDAAKTLTLRPNLKGEKNFTLSTTVEFQLTTGNKYAVIFWADATTDSPYTVNFGTDGATMTVDYSDAVSNDENRDAFYKYYEFSVSGSQTETIELKRPFAQLNIGTNDYTASTNAGYTVSHVKVEVPAYDTLDLVSGEATGDVTTAVLFDYAAIPTNETFPVTGYEYMAMNYVLMNSVKETFDVTFTYATAYDSTTKTATEEKVRTVGSVPLERNHRTNLYGQLLTGDVVFNVIVNPDYDDPAHEAEGIYRAAAFGGEVTLTEDVVLTEPLNVQAAMTINLNGHTISNASGYAIENSGNLTISGDGNFAGLGGIRSNGGSITINGGTFTCSSDWNDGTYQHILKAVDTKVVINGGTFDATIGGVTNAMINVSDNSVVTINGGTFKNVNGVLPTFAPYMFTYEGSGKLIINDGEFYGGWRFNGTTATTDIYGGNFTVSYDGQSFQAGNTHVLTVYGGTFSLANGGKLNPTNYVATGLKAAEVSGVYHIFPEAIADAVTVAGVTATTETVADVKTALATDNGETTLYIWNGVAYIAKYGEITMAASAESTTTVRGVVEENTNLKNATVAEGIEVVGNRTFRRCYNLESVELPSTLTEISSGAFQSCNKLANVTIPAGVTTIGEGAFSECASLTSITIPAGVTRLEKDVLRATGLTSIECHEGVTYIGDYAFRDCESLTEVKIFAPEFTMTANTFLNAAAPYPTMTIYVANAKMKAYVESMIGTHALTYTTVVVM